MSKSYDNVLYRCCAFNPNVPFNLLGSGFFFSFLTITCMAFDALIRKANSESEHLSGNFYHEKIRTETQSIP